MSELDHLQIGATEHLLHQRAVLAEFGCHALAETDLDRVLAEGARLCAEGLGVPLCKVLEHRPDRGDLIVRAGVGWKPGVVGRSLARADAGNPGGKAFATGEPVIVPDLGACEGMDLPAIYPDHGIVSTANVPIRGGPGGPPYGVLGVDARERGGFGQHDLDFLQGYADVLANAVRAHRRSAALRAEGEAKAVLLREQQHRVRNNLMAIAGMLQGCERDAARDASRACFGAVRRRVFALAAVYDHLLGAGLPGGGDTDLRAYLAVLCDRAHGFYNLGARAVALSFEAGDDALPMGADACTFLGVVVNELIANAVEHAFGPPGGGGRIAVRLGRGAGGGAVVTVEDNGIGLPPGAESSSLGLGFARKLLERMGSSLALRSAPGRTVWTIALPEGARA